MHLVVMVVRGENMQMKEPMVNQMEEVVKAGTRKPAMEQRQANTATTGSGTRSNLVHTRYSVTGMIVKINLGTL
jgi:hypothetical protein